MHVQAGCCHLKTSGSSGLDVEGNSDDACKMAQQA